VQLKDVLEQRKSELNTSYEHLLQHIAAIRKQVHLFIYLFYDLLHKLSHSQLKY